MSEPLLIEQKEGIAFLTLNRPDKRNALDDRLIAALKQALRAADADPAVRVIALRGAGKDFSSGADLSALRKIARASVMENLADVDGLAELFLFPRRLRKTLVALVRGRALAGGCGLAIACDLVLASRHGAVRLPGGAHRLRRGDGDGDPPPQRTRKRSRSSWWCVGIS